MVVQNKPQLLMEMQDLTSNKQSNNDGLIRGHRAKINILYDDNILLSQKEINEIVNKYFEQFNLEKKEKIK